MSEWQPIETAPKDGTNVLLWCAHAEPFACVGTFYKHENDRWSGWLEAYDGTDLPEPTHWMPLPAAPSAP